MARHGHDGVVRPITDKPFHEALPDLMREMGIRHNELARRVSFGHSWLSYIKRAPGDRRREDPTVENLDEVTRALDGWALEHGYPRLSRDHFIETREHRLRHALEQTLPVAAEAARYRDSLAKLGGD